MTSEYQKDSTDQINIWKGEFGDAYVDRNDLAAWKIEQGSVAFRRLLNGTNIKSVLEIGSNIGRNLMSIHALLGDRIDLYAVEPNRKAYNSLISQHSIDLKGAWNCDVFSLPLADSEIDMVFTTGVLIHIAPDDLDRATDEIVRVAKKYVLCIEYFSHSPVEIPYRDKRGLLFKRDFGAFYSDRFPMLKCVNYGFLWQREFSVFDNLNWWLFEKREK